MRRRAETLIEFITALAIFSVIMAGVFSFMANQTENIARLNDRDFFMYHAEKWLNEGGTATQLDTERGQITFTHNDENLIISDGKNSMTFRINFN